MAAGRDELNRINVFPVPDGDTGTNFSVTLRAVSEALHPLQRPTLPEVTRVMADACVLSAHGNSGMLLSQFLLGFRDRLGDRGRASPRHVARAMRGGVERLYTSLDDPVEGTILTVCRGAADAAESVAPTSADFVDFLHRVLARARATLLETRDMLAALRDAGVVDAGGQGFVRMLEGIARLIEGAPTKSPSPGSTAPPGPPAAAAATVATERDFRFCTEVLARGSGFPPTTQIRAQLRSLGGSIVVLAAEDLLKIHVHTDDPERVYALAATWGRVETTKADDVREQHRALHATPLQTISVVVDSSSDLPDDLVGRHGIVVVPIQLIEGEHTYRDGIDIHAQDIYARMRHREAHFTTSQPAPGAFVEAYRDARSGAQEVLCLTLAARLSGTFNGAQTAATVSGLDGITVFDSRTTSLGLGMLALYGAELVDAGWSLPNIVTELDRVRDQSGALIALDTLDNLVHSGRVGRARGWLGELLDLKPILELSSDGEVELVDRVRGRASLVPRMLGHLDRRFSPRPSRLRIGIAHADAGDVAETVRTTIEAKHQPHQCLVGHVTAAIGVHAGPGAWGIFYQIEDGAPSSTHKDPTTSR